MVCKVFVFLFLSTHLFAQQPTQTIRGTVIGDASNSPLPFATVRLQNTPIGTITDRVGNFGTENIPIGRYIRGFLSCRKHSGCRTGGSVALPGKVNTIYLGNIFNLLANVYRKKRETHLRG